MESQLIPFGNNISLCNVSFGLILYMIEKRVNYMLYTRNTLIKLNNSDFVMIYGNYSNKKKYSSSKKTHFHKKI